MLIHVVRAGETATSIAGRYGIPVLKLIEDNKLDNPFDLVVGQSIVIAYPEQTYVIKPGDTLLEIARSFDVTLMEIYRNNPFLAEREFIYPGETIVIRYDRIGNISINGYAIPFINTNTLKRTLPYLTYLSIFNYRTSRGGEIIKYYDDSEIIQMAKDYRVAPLMLLTILTLQGEADLEIGYEILENEDYQDKLIENVLVILKEQNYYGINLSFQYLDSQNVELYNNFFYRVKSRLSEEGFVTFVTITPIIRTVNDEVEFEEIDYSTFAHNARELNFMNYNWASNVGMPSPITSIRNLDLFLEHFLQELPPDNIVVGFPIIAYDWLLPYVVGFTRANSLTVESALNLAREEGVAIQFDKASQTPFFEYSVLSGEEELSHVVWFIDARTMKALTDLVVKYKLKGTGIWNIMVFNTQLWLVLNSQFEIDKVI